MAQTNIDTRATTTQVNAALKLMYAKSEVNTLLAAKQYIASNNSLTINQIMKLQNQVDAKASLTSPAFIGTPNAPIPYTSSHHTQLATIAYVQDVVYQIVDASPDTLNTLTELYSALEYYKTKYFVTINNALASNSANNH